MQIIFGNLLLAIRLQNPSGYVLVAMFNKLKSNAQS